MSSDPHQSQDQTHHEYDTAFARYLNAFINNAAAYAWEHYQTAGRGVVVVEYDPTARQEIQRGYLPAVQFVSWLMQQGYGDIPFITQLATYDPEAEVAFCFSQPSWSGSVMQLITPIMPPPLAGNVGTVYLDDTPIQQVPAYNRTRDDQAAPIDQPEPPAEG